MTIYGVAILAGCFLLGQLMGAAIGELLSIDANIGGVGLAMLLLIFVNHYLENKKLLPQATSDGIVFWSNLYIPVIVAMSATQNVAAALSGGAVAILAGILVSILPLLLLPVVMRLMKKHNP